jgi:hypothetical protein
LSDGVRKSALAEAAHASALFFFAVFFSSALGRRLVFVTTILFPSLEILWR